MKEVQLTLKKLRRNEITVEEATKVIDENYVTKEEHKCSINNIGRRYGKRIRELEGKLSKIKHVMSKVL